MARIIFGFPELILGKLDLAECFDSVAPQPASVKIRSFFRTGNGFDLPTDKLSRLAECRKQCSFRISTALEERNEQRKGECLR